MRAFNYTSEKLKIHFLDHYNPDIFIDTWRFHDFHQHNPVNKQHIINLYQPKSLNIEDQLTLPQTPIMTTKNHEKLRGIQAVLSMFYKIKSCNNLKSAYEKKYNFLYDVVIRFRPDILLYDKLTVEKSDHIIIPKFSNFGGLNDQIAIGSSKNTDIYSSLYDHITTYLTEDKTNYLCMKPEYFVKYHLNKYNIPITHQYINYALMKGLGDIVKNEGRDGDS